MMDFDYCTNAPPSPSWSSVSHYTSVSSATTEPSPRFLSSIPTQKPPPLVLPHPALNDDDNQTLDTPSALVKPENFDEVCPLLYRSSFPKPVNFAFLKTLGLKSVISLVLDDYPHDNQEFLEQEGIQFFQFGIPGGKEPSGDIPIEKIEAGLRVIFDRANLPALVHCNKGKHRTGCLVGCLRKAQHWPLEKILDEYVQYSTPKSRPADQQFITDFDRLRAIWSTCDRTLLPSWLEGCQPR